MTEPLPQEITIDLERDQVRIKSGGVETLYPIGTPNAFYAISRAWLRSGWDNKYVYSFTWMGRPIVQLPEDLIRIQEVIHSIRPEIVIETGVAHGGSLIYYASLCNAMDRGRVIGIDVEIRPQNRAAIEEHILSPYITLIEGSSIDRDTVAKVKAQIGTGESVLVLLDSCHSKEHVLAELNAYAPLVTVGSYIVAMDGIMQDLAGAPRSQADWAWNNPRQAAVDFVKENPAFRIEEPAFAFNEGTVTQRVTYWPSAFIKRLERRQSNPIS